MLKETRTLQEQWCLHIAAVTLGFAFFSALTAPVVSFTQHCLVIAAIHFFLFSLLLLIYYVGIYYRFALMLRMTLFTHPSEVCYGCYDMGYMSCEPCLSIDLNAIMQSKVLSSYSWTQINESVSYRHNKCSFFLCI